MKSMVGTKVEVNTGRQHYKGYVVGHLFKSGKVDVKIAEVFKGSKAVGNTVRFSVGQLQSIS